MRVLRTHWLAKITENAMVVGAWRCQSYSAKFGGNASCGHLFNRQNLTLTETYQNSGRTT